jgi:hypothetical protein
MTLERKGDGLPIEKPTLGAGGGLDSLGGMVGDIDAQAHEAMNPGAAQAAAEAAANAPDYHRGAAGMVDLANAMISGYAPGAGWDAATGERMAASLAPVFEKYGWDMERALPCELVALMVCGPVLYQSAQAVALKIQTDRARLAHAARGMADPNTVAGQAAAQAAAQAVAPVSVKVEGQADELTAALSDLPHFPAM